jgi:cellulose synthase/poly-beta-1,6-N-acetylglucosamine synthase-like glycosyltransferase
MRNASPKGKAAGMNAAVAALECDYFVVLDADHHVDRRFLEVGLARFDDARVACAQGTNAIRNPGESLLCTLVEMEYLARFRGYYPGRHMAFFMGSGGIFRTADFRAIGGFNTDTLTEDVDISFRLYAQGKTLAFEERTGTDELATRTLRSWFWQRHRWFRGIWQAFSRHFRRVALPDDDFRKLRIPVVHFAVECTFLPTLTVLAALYALDRAGMGEFPFKPLLYGGLAVCLAVFSGGIVRGGRYHLLALNPLFAFYLLLYSLPACIAWVDNVLLERPYVWRQTLRPARSGGETPKTTPAPVGGVGQAVVQRRPEVASALAGKECSHVSRGVDRPVSDD